MDHIAQITAVVLLIVIVASLNNDYRYRYILGSIILLLPFYQVYIYFHYLAFVVVSIIIITEKISIILFYLKEKINKILFLFFLCALFSPLLTSEFSQKTFSSAIELIFYYMIFLVCLITMRKNLSNSYIPRLLLIGIVTSVFIQTMQLLGIEIFNIYTEDTINVNTGVNFESESKILRFWGPFGNSLTFSAYLAITGTICYGFFNSSRNKSTRIISYLILIITSYGIILTAGRTALVSLIIGLLICIYRKNKAKYLFKLMLYTTLVYFIYIIFDSYLGISHFNIYARFNNLSDDKNFRTELWRRSLPVLISNPLFGAGAGNLNAKITPLIHQIYIMPKEGLSSKWGHVENTYLSVLYTFGIIGFYCFMYMLVCSFNYCIKLKSQETTYTTQRLINGLIPGWIVIFLNMITNPIFVVDCRMIILMLILVSLSITIKYKYDPYVHLKYQSFTH